MTVRRYAHVPSPWKAAVDLSSDEPARFYAALIGQAFNSGLPASRRWGHLHALAGRRGVPERLVARSLRALPRFARPDLDDLLTEVARAWPVLAAASPRLPRRPPRLSGLSLERSAGVTVFVFADGSGPLLVLKMPAPGNDRVDVEMKALSEAEPAQVGPLPLGRIAGARVQEAVAGRPLPIVPLTPQSAGELVWTKRHQGLASGVTRLAVVSSIPEATDELATAMDRALREGPINERCRRVVNAAWKDVRRLNVSVLRHGDTSAQNCLYRGDEFAGLVDWEWAKFRGAPGFDMWNAALAYIEHGIGLRRWSQARVVKAFEAAWMRSEFGRQLQGAARETALAAGVGERDVDALEVIFFARRLGRRVMHPMRYATGVSTAATMLEVVCER